LSRFYSKVTLQTTYFLARILFEVFMPDTDKDAENRIPTNLRTLLILEAMAQSDGAITATELNAQIGLPKQTLHRLCATLEAEGFLSRQGNSKRLLPGRRLRDLGAGLLHASRAHIARHQVLLEIARQIRETVNFVVPEATGMNYVDRVETDWPFRIQLPVGSNVPFHCTASGKVFMASLTPRARTAFVSGLTLNRLTDRTHVDVDSLLDDLKQIAKQGYAQDDEEFMEGMVAIAVPVLDSQGRYTASLAFHGPRQRIDLSKITAERDALIDGAAKLSNAMMA
jgi:DNA-binding IclR family transcriptional regulator